jgi:hypothetical protein
MTDIEKIVALGELVQSAGWKLFCEEVQRRIDANDTKLRKVRGWDDACRLQGGIAAAGDLLAIPERMVNELT